MNFTSDIKKELIKQQIGEEEKKAALSAYFSVCGAFAEDATADGAKTPRFFLVSETERVAEYFTEIFSDLFGDRLIVSRAVKDRLSGRSKLILEYPKDAEKVLCSLGLYEKKKGFCAGVPKGFFKDEARRNAYVKGAFLGGGSLTLPAEDKKTGYHLEFVFPDRFTLPESDKEADGGILARDFCKLAEEDDLLLKCVRRGGETVAYMKSKEAISDFLSVAGADGALKKFTAFCEKRERNNQVNRAANCSSSNADKTATAAVKQVIAIEKLVAAGEDKNLPAPLRELIEFRLKNPTMSLQELADGLNVTKSCLNHRMRKLTEEAAKLPDEERDKTVENAG